MAYPILEHLVPVAAAREMIRRMVALESQGPADTQPALRRLAARYRLSVWTLEHIRKGRAKTVEASLAQKLRSAYFDHCKRQVERLQHELQIERARNDDLNADLLAEAQALLAKLEQSR